MEDKFIISLGSVRKDIQDFNLTIGVVTEDLHGRSRDAKAKGKGGIYLTLDEVEWCIDTLSRSQAGLQSKFDILLESAKHEKLQNRLLEATQSGWLHKFANDDDLREAVLLSLGITPKNPKSKAA